MPAFQTPADIGNRALQHLGQRRMDPLLGFNEVSKNAAETSACYDKLREAELHRNVWKFAIKRQILRPIDQTTLILAPALFVPTTTYFRGSVVIDQNSNLWISRIPNNLGNDPITSTAWDPYYGPMTVGLYNSQNAYYAGELVYTTPGDGTSNVYLSLVTGNTLDPSLPNQWNANATYSLNQVVQAFPAWASGTTYSAGQTVSFTDGNTYTSLTNSNHGNTPSPTSLVWALMPVLSLVVSSFPSQTTTVPNSMSSPVIEWDIGTTYAAGNFVMFAGNEYVSLVANNLANVPNAAASTSWAQVTGGTNYMSLVNLNINQNPATTFVAAWASGTTYATGNKATGSDGNIYTSLSNGNLGNNPVSDGGVHWSNTGVLSPWTTTFTQGIGNAQWLQIGGASFPSGVGLTTPNIVYPVGSAPTISQEIRNVFRLPANFLRRAPRDPKAGSQSLLGAPGNLFYDDWEFEGEFIVSRDENPILFRFVANVVDVTKMDPMFCEGLAARVAQEVCEPLTQSTEKLVTIEKAYDKVMGEARIVNAIEVGSEEPAMDDFLAVRW